MQTVTKPRRKSRLTEDERQARNEISLSNATRFQPISNDVPVISEFATRGIPENEIITLEPGQNVFTYNAWQAKGRQVRKGEKSVSCTVWISVVVKGDPNAITESKRKDRTRSRMHHASLFHVSQTDEIGGASWGYSSNIGPSHSMKS